MTKELKSAIRVGKRRQINLAKMLALWGTLFGLTAHHPVKAQSNDYDKAIAKFTGEHKYDIERPGALDGITAPNFSGQTLDGTNFHLADLKGKVVVLNFWFIACAPCRMEVTPLNEVVKQFAGKDVLFMSIARDPEPDLVKHLRGAIFHPGDCRPCRRHQQRCVPLVRLPDDDRYRQTGKDQVLYAGW
ncbi:redoxin domain-containing protein [Mucilaginibacter sp. PAMB04168]|uniref:TlpA family protein disulfide reductase n=1 Tax=Mucilaginibacter sp. PAMB04168 TaxID=3138567 RepID=UPI0031F637D6